MNIRGPRWAALALAAASAGCGQRAGDRPNVWLVTLDTTRADHLGCYGCAAAKTPTVDRFAAEGVRFDLAFTPTPLTLPAHASILTGAYPMFHGVRNNGTFLLDGRFTTLAEVLGRSGYATAAFVGSFVLDSHFGLAQGFDVYDDRMPLAPGETIGRERRATAVADAAVAWLSSARGKGKPFFVWTHFYDAHHPYDPPAPFRPASADRRALYDGEIAYVDHEVARVAAAIEQAGGLDRTLVIVAGDHGEGLGEHGEATHGVFLYDATLRVPLVVRYPPAVPARRVVDRSVVRLIDVAPTVLELLDLPRLTEAQGSSLAATWKVGTPAPRVALAETLYPRLNLGWSDLAAIRTEKWKWIGAPKPELYDCETDPGETANRIAEDVETASRLRSTWERELSVVRGAGTSGESPLEASTRERLAALGYVWMNAAPGADGGTALPDPKDRIAVVDALAQAEGEVVARNFEKAESILAPIVAAEPHNADAQNLRGLAALARGRLDDAQSAFERVLEANPKQFMVRVNLAGIFRQSGRPEDLARAEAEYRRAVGDNPTCAPALVGLGDVLLALGRDAEARDALLAARRLGNPTADLWTSLGQAHSHLGDLASARAAYEEALRIDASSRKAHNNLGLVLLQSRDAKGALAQFEETVRIDPAFATGFANLARARAALGDDRGAVEAYRRSLELAPGAAPVHLELARALARLGDKASAIESYDRVLELAPAADAAFRASVEAERDALR